MDYPGEWLADREHENLLFETMKKSQILMIAIDTPHMMEKRENIMNDAIFVIGQEK